MSDASTGLPLEGALVVVIGDGSATSGTDGTFDIQCVSAGDHQLETSADGYVTRDDDVTVRANGTVNVSIALIPIGECDTEGRGDIRIVLTWGESPADLDSHLSGPDVETEADRFHVAFYASQPVTYASLDVDDVDSFGPETVTVSQSTTLGTFVAGDYHYWVHNFSETPEFDVSSAVVTVFQCDSQVGQFDVGAAAGDPTLDLWHVFNFTLTAEGDLVITPVQTFLSGDADTVL